MNIVNRVTLQHIKQNKRRTAVTIFGIIISVAMITAVSTITGSFMDLFQRVVLSQTGDWHFEYQDTSFSSVDTIQSSPDVKAVILSQEVGYAPLDGSTNWQRPFLYISKYDIPSVKQLPISIVSGRYPESADELAISLKATENMINPYKVGDRITLTTGTRHYLNAEGIGESELTQAYSYSKTDETFVPSGSQEYTVTGIIDDARMDAPWNAGYTAVSGLDKSALTPTDPINVQVSLDHVTNGIYSKASQIAADIGYKGDIKYNNNLLFYYGVTDDTQVRNTMTMATVIVGFIILVGSVSLIYNAFSISLSERSRQLGMLSSVGATKTQKRNSVFFESLVVGIIAIPIGLLCGTAGMSVTFRLLNPLIQSMFEVEEPLRLVVSGGAIAGAVLFSILMLLLSAYIPARRASRITPIDAIRQTQDFRLSAKAVKTSALTRKIFGFEAELGLKNLKRNRHRYFATLFSLIISVILFLTAMTFSNMMSQTYGTIQGDLNCDVLVSIEHSTEDLAASMNPPEISQTISEILNLDNVSASAAYQNAEPLMLFAGGEMATKEAKEHLTPENGSYPFFVSIVSMDDENLRKFAEQTGANYGALKDPTNPQGILLNAVTYKLGHQYYDYNYFNIQDGEVLNLSDPMADSPSLPGTDIAITANVATDLVPQFQSKMQESPSQVMLYTSTETADAIHLAVAQGRAAQSAAQNQADPETLPDNFDAETPSQQTSSTQSYSHHIYINTDDGVAVEDKARELSRRLPDGTTVSVYNVSLDMERSAQLTLLINVFLYGFVALITAISIANIFNTISTSIALRKREFSMLKSVGMTPKGFNRMIRYESLFYGIKTLVYGLPLSFLVIFLLFRVMGENFALDFPVPWGSILIVIAAVFFIVSTTMLYATSKVRRGNIIDGLKQENV